MVGLVSENMARPDAEDGIDPKQVREQMQLPPELKEVYLRVVTAGMKLMFSKETQAQTLKVLDQEGTMSQKLGEGVALVLMTLFLESNKTIPPQVILPAGIELVVQAADFVKQAGLAKITNKDIGDGVQIMMANVFKAFNIDPDKVFANIRNADPNQIAQMISQQGAPAQGQVPAQAMPAQGM